MFLLFVREAKPFNGTLGDVSGEDEQRGKQKSSEKGAWDEG